MTMGWMTSGGWADLLAPVLRDFMEVLDQGGHDGRGRYVDQILHVTKGLLVVEIQPEFVLHLPHRLVRFQGDVRNARVAHECEQVQNQIGVSSEMEEGGVAELAELLVVLRVDPAHGLDHLLAELHGRRQRLGIAAEDVTKVDVEEFTRFRQH